MQSNLEKKAILIGETNLCAQCARHLIENNWKIIMVSDDQGIIAWAKNNSVLSLPTDQLTKIKENDFYLFSIINPYLIPKYFLENKNILLALNYHDAPLPKYAGINSTTWAIINNEKSHGITLHLMTSGIDDGDIAAQSIINIEKDETAISLNLKCSEQLLLLFKELIVKIETDTLTFSKQNLSNRTYYGGKYIPTNYSIINGIKDPEVLHRLVRGLTFGDGYDNQVATVKVYLNNQFYIVEDFNNKTDSAVLFNTVRDVYGNKTSLKIMHNDISTEYVLVTDDLKYLSDIKTLERKNKKQILGLLSYSDTFTNILDHVSNESDNNNKKHIQEFAIPSHVSTTSTLALAYLVLARFFHNNDFIISLYTSSSDIPAGLCGLVENRNFIHINNGMLDHSFAYLENHLVQLQKGCCTLTKDFGYRYGLQLLTDIAIAVGKIESTDKHKIIIKIENNRLIVEGASAYQLQIDSIAESIGFLLSKNINKDIATHDLKSISILNNVRYQQIVHEFNKTDKDYPCDKTIHKLFEEQALKTPNNIAVVYENTKLTYQELNNKANQLAHYLKQNYNIKPDDLIALCLDRNEWMLITILGVLKSGGAYVPLDPNYPSERIRYILDDIETKVVLTNNVHTNKIQRAIKLNPTKEGAAVLALDGKETQAKLADQKNINPITLTTNNDLAYVIYTSGTTGTPKGVMIEHKGVISLVKNVDYINIDASDSFIQFSDPGFDAITFEIWASLLNGSKLVIPDNKIDLFGDTKLFREALTKNKITILWLTKTLFDQLFFSDESVFKDIKHLLVGGEALNKQLVLKLINSDYTPKNVINGYGPTENTTFSCTLNITKESLVNIDTVPIGIPLTNRKAYVLDKNLSLLPIGAIGELHVGGVGLARGYLNNPSLTTEKFISNPFQTSEEKSQNKNSGLYKTGDLVRWLPDGNLEYIGRNDFQVKIRGYRIELGEIENKLLSYPDIKQSVVLIKERTIEQISNKYLLAYYVSDERLDEEKIWSYLATQLPEYMLPQILIHINKLPLTANGKLDKKALPEPESINQSEYVAPRNELEKNICEIYAQVLNLPITQVGIKSDFFRMGGDSISSIILASRIRQKLELNVNVKDIFSYRNIEQLVERVLASQNTQKESAINTNSSPINQEYLNKIKENIGVEDAYFTNNLQQGFIYHAIRHGKVDDAYLSQFVWKYKTSIDESKFKKAWQVVQKKYPSLRLRFTWDKELIQIIDKNPELDFRYIDLTNSSKTIEKIIDQDRQERYDLRKGHLIRIYLVKSAESDYLCICSIHHIIVDGWSLSLLIDSVHEIYSQLLINNQLQVLEDIVYKETQKYLQEHKNEDQEYWSDHIKQIEDRGDLSFLLKPSAKNIDIKNHTKIELEQEQCVKIMGQKFAKLKSICQTNAVTINAVIQYAWHKILHIYGFSNTTIVGTVVSGRNLPINNIENSVGLFINTLPLVFDHNNKSNLIEQIKIIQDSINEANSKSNVNLSDIQPDSIRLFDSLLVYENYPPQKCTANIKYENMREIFKVDYPLAIIIYENDNALKIVLKYAGELFDQKTISQLLHKLLFFIEQISEDPYKKTLTYLNQEEYQQVVIKYNKTEKDYPSNKVIHQIFEEQVLKTPNNIAVIYEDIKLTYQELNSRANQLANYILKNNNIEPDSLIALMLDRNEYMIISILAVLKTGAAYVPIDLNHPDKSIRHILEDTKAKIIIKRKNTKYKIQNCNAIEIDSEELQQTLLKENASNPKTNVSGVNLIYVIYTSGTTGKPKGVMLEHTGCVNRILEMIRISQITQHSKVLFKTNYIFDVSFSDIFTALLTGASLFVTKEIFDIDEISTKIKKYSIDVCHFTPSQFDVIKNTKGIELFKTFKTLHFSGEAFDMRLLNDVDKNTRYINYYGPTEAGEITFDICLSLLSSRPLIGYPISNAKLFILDKNLLPLPIGAIGELYLGGVCLARGYLNQPELTREKFIDNPFQAPEEKSKNVNNTLYRTGDLVRMLSDGNIEYIGRNDFQVKVRGYRVELKELENKIISHPEIEQAVVIVEEKTGSLVGYYVSSKKIEEQKIKNYLLDMLPDYMIPGSFIYMQKLPLTTNGKLDKKALPRPALENKYNYIAPKNKQEKIVCEAFAKILDINKVGVNDDFFSLGGNSIQAIRLASILQTNFIIKVADIFNLRTPAKLAKSSVFGKNFLQHKLELVKLAYEKKKNDGECISAESQLKIDSYMETVKKLYVDVFFKKPIRSVLLTGSTGYLGCNILNQLLELTDYKIYLLVRANSQPEASERVGKKYQFYFDESLNNLLDSRIFIIKADIEKDYLGLTQEEYIDLTTKIDSVIHAAALVKHFGEYDKFYSANVDATTKLLEFTKLTESKDFHYISTTGVLSFSALKNKKYLSTEDDLIDNTEILNNVYVQTKSYGERRVIEYRNYGINCNVYRVGNLAFISKNYRAQKNIEDNAFYNWLKCLFTIESSTETINTVEISQVDLTAKAIVKIFDKKYLSNQVHHVFNPYLFDIGDILKNNNCKILPIGSFIDCIEQHIKNSDHHELIVRFLLLHGWADWWEKQDVNSTKILQNRTQHILELLGFEWPAISDRVAYNYFSSLKLIKGGGMTFDKSAEFLDE